MKNIPFYILLLPLLAFVAPPTEEVDPKYEIVATPICWKYSGVDSNLVRYVLISTSASSPVDLMYLNAQADTVDVSVGGTLQNGWCCDCAGTGGGTTEISASNGLTEQTGNDIELGGTLEKNTQVLGGAYNLDFGQADFASSPVGFMYYQGANKQVGMYTLNTTNETDMAIIPGEFLVESNTYPYSSGSGSVGHISASPGEVSFDVSNAGVVKVFTIGAQFVITGLPNYANDAAADADGALPSGGMYTVTGDRAIRRKP